ncbi:MAG TPA: hypothetical protein VH415_10140 [Nitrososphaeraceae archaeon]|jgi:hypothetical protein
MVNNSHSAGSYGKNHHKGIRRSEKMIYLASIIAIGLVSSFLIQVTSVPPAEALTRYYNCLARVVNKNATLSIANVDACYNLIFKGALDYYGIKQTPSTDDKNSKVETDSPKQSEPQIDKADDAQPKTDPETVRGTSNLNSVFG